MLTAQDCRQKFNFRGVVACQTAYNTLASQSDAVDDNDVAELTSVILGVAYTDSDVRLMLGRATTPVERGALEWLSGYLTAINPDDLSGSRKQAILNGKDPDVLDFVVEYYTDFLNYQQQVAALCGHYNTVLEALPTVDDPTELVGYPGNPNQPESLTILINALVEHFRLIPGRLVVPPPLPWSVTAQLVISVRDTPEGPLLLLHTPKGAIALNAEPV